MWSVPSRIVSALAIPLIIMVALSGCGGMTKEEARDKTHELTDALAQRVGTNPEKGIDGPVGGLEPDPRPYYRYDVDVDIEPGTLARIRSKLLEDLREQGWTARDGAPDDDERAIISFRKEDEGLSMGITVTEDKGYAVVSSSAHYDE